jgi:hypothetical protein
MSYHARPCLTNGVASAVRVLGASGLGRKRCCVDALPAATRSTGAAVLVANTLCTGGLFRDDERQSGQNE